MPVAAPPRRRRNSSSESSDEPSSSSDDEVYVPSTTVKAAELTLKDDEDPIALQAPLPEEYGKDLLTCGEKNEVRFSRRVG